MAFQDFLKREKHVVLNAQSRNFRIAKWIVISIVLLILYEQKGIVASLSLFVFSAFIGTCLHFFLRYKTEGWTKSWGPYKRIALNDE